MTDVQNLSGLLSQVATIASIKASTLGMKRQDKEAAKMSERDHNAMSGIASVSISRLAGAEDRIKNIVSIQREAREILYGYTTAWGDRRLLPNTMLEKFMVDWGKQKTTFDEEVNRLSYDAPELIEKAQANKGNFKVDIPTVEEIRGAFSLEFAIEAVPDVSQFQTSGLDKAVEKQMKEIFERNIQAAYTDAQADAVRRVAKPLQTLVERMEAYNQKEIDQAKGLTTGRQGFFRDTIVSNVQELAEVFGAWNMTNDPVLKKLDDALQSFQGIAADDLRNSKDLRDAQAKKAEEILEQIRAGGWL